jgi:predicted amidohydrolase
MARVVRIASVQFRSAKSKAENLAKARSFIGRAAELGAELVCLPEWLPMITVARDFARVAEPLDGPFVSGLREAAEEAGIYAIAGILEASGSEKAYNAAILIGPDGSILGKYRKAHLADIFGHRESDGIAPGGEPGMIHRADFGTIGAILCYDVRFPELPRALAIRGAEILFVPAAWFSGPAKEAQWEVLLRARAIENGFFVVGSCQVGEGFVDGTMVVDPRGIVIGRASIGEGIICADLDLDEVGVVRELIPWRSHRRPELYSALLER